jgi:hypothetical protein
VHTRLGSFLPPAPTPSLTTHSAPSLSPPHNVLGIFEIGFYELFAQAGHYHNSPDLYLLRRWDYRCDPPAPCFIPSFYIKRFKFRELNITNVTQPITVELRLESK